MAEIKSIFGKVDSSDHEGKRSERTRQDESDFRRQEWEREQAEQKYDKRRQILPQQIEKGITKPSNQ